MRSAELAAHGHDGNLNDAKPANNRLSRITQTVPQGNHANPRLTVRSSAPRKSFQSGTHCFEIHLPRRLLGARDLILSLRDMGVRLAMDDFGTGASSLSCLRDYPFHSIKIDKTFLTNIGRDPHVLAVAHATINVIENLGMTSVAEGIEEPQVLAMLQSMGCRCGQGYLFARPMPAGDLLEVMAACPGLPAYTSTCEPI
jgi:hypothetical protein